MKLYTEEQVNELMVQLQKAFLPENICDGPYCMGCWKDVVRETLKSMVNLTPIEIPSDEEISEKLAFHAHGARWVINRIKQQINGN
jgi:hypothetical protein